MHDKVKRPQSVSKIKLSVNALLVLSSVDLSYSCFQNNTCPECWKSRRRTRTRGVVCWLTLPLLGAASLRHKTFLWVYRQSTSVPVCHSSVFPMGILFLSSSSYSPPRKPCLYKCKNSLIKTESFECAHALVYKVKRVCFKHYIGLSLLLVLYIAPTGFLQVPRFFPSSKFSISKLRIRPGMVDKEPLCWCATSDSLFIIFLNDA